MPQLIIFFLAIALIMFVVMVIVWLAIVALFGGFITLLATGVCLAATWVIAEFFQGRERTIQTHALTISSEGVLLISSNTQGKTNENLARQAFDVAVCATALVMVFALYQAGSFASKDVPAQLTGTVVAFASFGTYCYFRDRVHDLLPGALRNEAVVSRPIQAWVTLASAFERINEVLALAGARYVDMASAANEVAQRSASEILRDESTIEGLMIELAKRTRRLSNDLESPLQRWADLKLRLASAGTDLLNTDSPSMFQVLDNLCSIHEDMLGEAIKGDVSRFEELLSGVEADLESLLWHARATPGEDCDANVEHQDPYGILGVAPNTSLQAIEEVVKRLRRIYHPDSGLVADDRKFKEITEAWNAIKAGH